MFELFGFELSGIVYGAVAGVAVGLGGYFKKTKKVDFSFKKLGTTVVLGALAGGYAQYAGITTDAAQLMLISAGVDVLVENWFKAGKRKLVG